MPLSTHTRLSRSEQSLHRHSIKKTLVRLSNDLCKLSHPGEVDSWLLSSLDGMGLNELASILEDIAATSSDPTGNLWDPTECEAVSLDELCRRMARWTLSSMAMNAHFRSRLRLRLTQVFSRPSQVDHIIAMTEPVWHLGNAAATRTLNPTVSFFGLEDRVIGQKQLPRFGALMRQDERLAQALQAEGTTRCTIKRMMHLYAPLVTPTLLRYRWPFANPSVQRRLNAFSVECERAASAFGSRKELAKCFPLLTKTFPSLICMATPILIELERSTKAALRLTALQATDGHDSALANRMGETGKSILMNQIAWDVWAFLSKIAFFDDVVEKSYDPAFAQRPLMLDTKAVSIFDFKPDQAGAIAAAGLAMAEGETSPMKFLPDWCDFWAAHHFGQGLHIRGLFGLAH